MKSRDKFITLGVVFVVLLLALGGILTCLWKHIFGIPCPGCGMSRAYMALLAGDLKTAFLMHPLFFAPPLILGLCLFKKNIATNTKFWIVVGVVFIGVYILRMFLHFPGTPPMDYQSDNIIHNLTERIALP